MRGEAEPNQLKQLYDKKLGFGLILEHNLAVYMPSPPQSLNASLPYKFRNHSFSLCANVFTQYFIFILISFQQSLKDCSKLIAMLQLKCHI